MNSLHPLASRIVFRAKGALVAFRLSGMVALMSLLVLGVGVAQAGEGKGHRGPPEEAVLACKSLAAGANCKFEGRRGAMAGNCWAPEGKPLACKPKDAPDHDRPSAPAAKK